MVQVISQTLLQGRTVVCKACNRPFSISSDNELVDRVNEWLSHINMDAGLEYLQMSDGRILRSTAGAPRLADDQIVVPFNPNLPPA